MQFKKNYMTEPRKVATKVKGLEMNFLFYCEWFYHIMHHHYK